MSSSKNSNISKSSDYSASLLVGAEVSKVSRKTSQELDLFKRIVVDLDMDALAQYYRENKKALFKYAVKSTSAEIAEDSVQATLLKIIELVKNKSDEYPSGWCKNFAHFDTWVHQILKNTIYATYHKDNKAPHFSIEQQGEKREENYSPSFKLYADPDTSEPLRIKSIFERERNMELMVEKLKQMSLSDVRLERAFMIADGQPYTAVAEAYSIPLNTAKTSVYYVRQELKNKGFHNILRPI